MKPPQVRYTSTPDGDIAYQLVGEGPIDLVFQPSGRDNLEIVWEQPELERFLRRLASFSRLILMNRRGTGLSDPIPLGAPPTFEEQMMDILRVLDAVGSERAAFLVTETQSLPTLLFAATFPERTQGLVLLNCVATMERKEDYPWGFPPAALKRFIDYFSSTMGTGEQLSYVAPERAGDERFREWFSRLERLSSSRNVTRVLSQVQMAFDARGILPTIKVPTLVISHTETGWVRLGHGRYLAEHIPGARYIEREGFWGVYWLHDVDWVLDEVQTFLTGTRGPVDLDNRILATVLFTDIVGSTRRAAEIGDERWRWLLDEHDKLARREIERFRGRALKSTGDGVMATFDGPARAIRCATAINEAVRSLDIEIRTGLHTGEVEQRGDDVGGIAVHIAARVMAEAGPSDVLVSGSVPPLVAGSGIEFDDRGEHALKGVPGEWRLYAVRKP